MSISNLHWGAAQTAGVQVRVLIFASIGAVIFGLAVVITPVSPTTMIFLAVYGVCCAPMFPFLMALASLTTFPDAGDRLLPMAGMSLAAAIGGAALVSVQGGVAGATSVQASMLFAPICAFFSGILVALWWSLRDQAPSTVTVTKGAELEVGNAVRD